MVAIASCQFAFAVLVVPAHLLGHVFVLIALREDRAMPLLCSALLCSALSGLLSSSLACLACLGCAHYPPESPSASLLSPLSPLGIALARMVDVTACNVAVLASLLLSCLLLPLLLVLVSPFSPQTLLPRR